MLTRILASRGLLSFGSVLLMVAIAVLGYRLIEPNPPMRTYCADMPDAIGLFQGSDVTIMGVRVGSVTSIENRGATARVTFTTPADRKLPPDVGATTLSDTLIADRRLALIGDEPSGAGWPPGQCITRTMTPKSLSETFTALAQLADGLNGTADPAHPDAVRDGVAAVNSMTTGTGEQINTIIHRLGAALDSPDAAIGNIAATIDALGSLLRSAAANWPEIRTAVTGLTQMLDDISNIAVPPVLTILDKLLDVLPALNSAAITLGGPLLRRLDAVTALPQLLSAGVSGLRDLLTMTPPLAAAFSTAIDPQTHTATIAYASPRVAIPQTEADLVCPALEALSPGACADRVNGLVNVPLAQLVLGTAGAR